MNIVDPILFQCRFQAPLPAMIAPGAALPLISYGRLERFIHNIARNAHAQGLARGQTVGLRIDEPILHAAFILGLARIGIASVSVNTPDLPAELKLDAFIVDRPSFAVVESRVIHADMGWTEGDGIPVEAPLGEGSSTDLCRISLTSGTTGEPKAVAFSHELLLRRIARYGWAYGEKLANCSRLFVDPGIGTQIGFLFWLYMLSKGGTVVFRGGDAVETMQTFHLNKIQGMVASPAALAEFVSIYDSAPAFPSSFEFVAAAGSLMSQSLSESVRARLCNHLICAYGATETHSVAMAPAHSLAGVAGAVGFVAPDMRVQIIDHAGDLLPPGHEGLVRIRSEVAAEGYVGDPAETAQVFRDGWFHPGDIGTLTEDGMLRIGGREKTTLNLGGDKVNPERIEQVVLSFPGVRIAAAFGKPNALGIEELTVAVVGELVDEEALRAHCERRLAAAFVPRRVFRLDDIPVNEAGKVDRRGLMNLVETL